MAPTILIVDDEPEMVEFLEDLMDLKGYQTLPAYNGEDCLRKAHQAEPDLILLDLTLPDEDGLEILKKLRKAQDTKDIPVLVVSGQDNPQARINSLQAGAGAFLLKPYHPRNLLEKIQKHIKSVA